MKYIYVNMVELPTLINRIVNFLTHFKYTHFSISFDKNLTKLYSFQIKNKKIFLVGGLVEETQASYFHGKKNIHLKQQIFKIPVSNDEYDRIYNFVENIKNDKEYMFNYVSALFMFALGGVKSYKAYHCVEFVSEVINLIDAINLPKPPHKMHPRDLYKVLLPYCCAIGKIYSKNYSETDDLFFAKIKPFVAIKKSLYSIREAICRAVFKKTTKRFNYKNINFYRKDVIS